MQLETIQFKDRTLSIIDQTLLPNSFKVIPIKTIEEAVEAIRSLRVRGAPAIGVFAAYALVQEAINLANNDKLTTESFNRAAHLLEQSRPTAVNLAWAVNEIRQVFDSSYGENGWPEKLLLRASELHREDREMCLQIGLNGAPYFSGLSNILTHCNAGILATGGQGTALSVIYQAALANPRMHVFVDETRPLGQGARLTCFELQKNDVNCTLLTDNAAASLFASRRVDAVIAGADRIALNGDAANKIGTYNLAVLARAHKVPFYIAAPFSTFDLTIESGKEIPIEQRDPAEVVSFWKIENPDINIYNPAFDISPAGLITAIITDKGVIEKPDAQKIQTLFKN